MMISSLFYHTQNVKEVLLLFLLIEIPENDLFYTQTQPIGNVWDLFVAEFSEFHALLVGFEEFADACDH